jgi:hypothetical protein
MANSYTQVCIQIVFAVQGRQNLTWREHQEYLEPLKRFDVPHDQR